MIKKIIKVIKKPSILILYLGSLGLLNKMDDKKYLELIYKIRNGEKLNIDNPRTFNEKLQWLKVYDHKDIYSKMVDKYEAKLFLSDLIGNKYIVKTYGVFNSFDEIDFDKLPDQFVIKCTHDCGGLIICKDKKTLDLNLAKKKINKCLKKNYYYSTREWPYKNVKPRIIIEELLVNDDGTEPIEYNFFCFNGIPKIVLTCHGDKRVKRYNDFYDMSFNKLDLKCTYDNSDFIEKKPVLFEEMVKLSTIISKDLPHLRVDFYLCDGKLYIGELTFYHWSGFGKYSPKKWNYELGDMLDLSNVKKNK